MPRINHNLVALANLEAVQYVFIEALKNRDMETIRGLQAYNVSQWIPKAGGSNTLAYILRKTIEKRREKRAMQERYQRHPWEISDAERRELFSNEVWITREEFVKDMGNFRSAIRFLTNLENQVGQLVKLFEKRNINPIIDGEQLNDRRGHQFRLSDIWNPLLERMERSGKEAEAYSYHIGAILTSSTLAALKLNKEAFSSGVRSFKPLLLIASKVKDDQTPLPYSEVVSTYEQCGMHEADLIVHEAFDAQKSPDTRYWKKIDRKNNECFVSLVAINVRPLLNQMAQHILRERCRQR